VVLAPRPTRIDGRLRTYRPSAECWTGWQRVEPALQGFDYVDVRRRLLDREFPPKQKDALLLALVRCARSDAEAAMCVTACLYPGLSRIVHRYRDILYGDEAWSGLVEALIRRLRTFKPDRRCRFVAANLLRDSAHQLRRVARSERMWRDHVQLHEEPVALAPTPVVTTDGGDPLALGAQLSPLDAALIQSTRLGGLSLADVAGLLGLSYEAAKKRRQRAEAIWAHHHADVALLACRERSSRAAA
jgi:DNA-directed RNA polymerase specialized sigma24 family protein